jgi:hypothetical protein
VTSAVGALSPDEIAQALASGKARAETYLDRGLIRGAALMLRGETAIVDLLRLLSAGRRNETILRNRETLHRPARNQAETGP